MEVSTSAPASSSTRTTSAYPYQHATPSGVRPSAVARLTSAPASISSRAIAGLLEVLALYRALHPVCSTVTNRSTEHIADKLF